MLVNASVFGALCECLLSKRRAPPLHNHMLVKSNRGEFLEGRLIKKIKKKGQGAQMNGKTEQTEKFTITDGR